MVGGTGGLLFGGTALGVDALGYGKQSCSDERTP